MRRLREFSPWAAVGVVALALVPIVLAPDRWAVIDTDGVGYQLWSHAIAKGDLSFQDYEPQLKRTGALAGADYERGVFQNKYPFGLGLLRLPVMVWVTGDFTPNPLPELGRAESLASLFLGMLALLVMTAFACATCARLGFDPWTSTVSITATVLGVGLLHYATRESAYTHIYSAAAFAILMFLAVGRRLPAVPLALVAFFIVAMRNINAVFLVLFLIAWIRVRRAEWRQIAPALVGAFVAVALQISYNSWASGAFALSSYGREPFLWSRPMHAHVIASYERGLFTYYPMLATTLAFGLSMKPSRSWAFLMLAVTALYVGIYGFWHSWSLGFGFGHRGFVDFAPLVIVVLAAALSAMRRAQRAWAVVLTTALALTSLKLLSAYWHGTLPRLHVDAIDYWRALFG